MWSFSRPGEWKVAGCETRCQHHSAYLKSVPFQILSESQPLWRSRSLPKNIQNLFVFFTPKCPLLSHTYKEDKIKCHRQLLNHYRLTRERETELFSYVHQVLVVNPLSYKVSGIDLIFLFVLVCLLLQTMVINKGRQHTNTKSNGAGEQCLVSPCCSRKLWKLKRNSNQPMPGTGTLENSSKKLLRHSQSFEKNQYVAEPVERTTGQSDRGS